MSLLSAGAATINPRAATLLYLAPSRRPTILDIRLIRENPDDVRSGLQRRGDTAAIALLDEIVSSDVQRRESQRRADDLRAELNAASKTFGALRGRASRGDIEVSDLLSTPGVADLVRDHTDLDFDSLAQRRVAEIIDLLQDSLRTLSESVDGAVKETSEIDDSLQQRLAYLPNLPHESVPDGRNEDDNVTLRTWGEPKTFDFQPQPHWDLGPALGVIDFERGVRMSGSRFYALTGPGAKLQRALIQWMLDLHVNDHGYTEVYPPFVVTQETLYASGQLPKFAENVYHDAEDDLWLVPTAEVPLTSMHRDEILEADQLPIHYVAYTPAFRREKMSAGRDIRGIKRGHQFDKVEMYKFVTPETSLDELESLLHDAEDILQRLDLAYRVVALCTGDLGQAAAKTYDIEVWAPGCDEWLEVSSCSTTEDYQSRRANIRYRPEQGARPHFLHTLNGSGLALPRLLIALLETYQQQDGSVTIPEVLQPYTGFASISA